MSARVRARPWFAESSFEATWRWWSECDWWCEAWRRAERERMLSLPASSIFGDPIDFAKISPPGITAIATTFRDRCSTCGAPEPGHYMHCMDRLETSIPRRP